MGTDFEVGRIGSPKVDIEADFPPFKVEANHSAVREKIICFPHSKNRQAVQTLKNSGLSPGFITAEKKDVASLGI